MTEMFGEAWSPMSVPDLAPDDDEVYKRYFFSRLVTALTCARFQLDQAASILEDNDHFVIFLHRFLTRSRF